MSEWKRVKIGDVAKVFDGPHATPPECETPGRYFIGIPQISPSGHIDFSSPRYISENDFPRWIKRVKPRYGDVVFSYEATLNLYALIPDGIECCLGRRMGLVRPDDKLLNFRFLYYYFYSTEWRNVVRQKTITGATVDRLPIKTFPDFEISLPPLPVQRRIADILSAYDDLIEVNRRRISLLEESARALYRNWFVNFRKWGGCCPSNIRAARLEELTKRIGTGLNPRKNFVLGQGSNYYVTIKNMAENTVVLDGKCDRVDDDAIKKINKRSDLQKGDLLFSGIGTIGRVSMIFETPTNWNTSESVYNLRPSDDISSEYLYLVLVSDAVQSFAIGNALGVAQRGIRMADLRMCPVVKPSKEVIDSFTKAVSPFLSQQNILRQQNAALAKARDMLLPKLMSGKIAVKEAG